MALAHAHQALSARVTNLDTALGQHEKPGRIRHLLELSLRCAYLRVSEAAYRVSKRSLDVLLAAVGLIVLSPLLLVAALAIVFTDFGPVFHKQERVGLFGRPFPFVKLRSMVTDADRLRDRLLDKNDHGQCVTFKMRDDPRITRVGRWIRRLSIDELPQLWSVITGDMSLVGPRPPLPGEVAHYHASDRRRLDVKPGLTCIWQVSGRGDVPFPQQVRMDVEYVERRGFWLDLWLLLKTIPAVLGRRGAY